MGAVARCTLAISDYPCFRIVTEYRHHEDVIAGLRAAGPAGHHPGAAPGNPKRALQPADQAAKLRAKLERGRASQVDFSQYMSMGYDSPMKLLNRRTDYMYVKL